MSESANPQLIALLKDAEADLAALERIVRRQLPEFKSKTLAGVRTAIATLSGHDEEAAVRADMRYDAMKSDGTIERMALERALADQVKWGVA